MISSRGLSALIFLVLPACQHKDAPTGTVAPSGSAASSPAPALSGRDEKAEDFRGSYVTNWGTAKCTQAARSVSCSYAGKSGSMDCKIIGERELDCEWDEPGASGKSRLVKKDDGRLVGTWGNGQSATNGGTWVFKPVAD